MKRLPKYNPEEVELTSLLERIIQLENKTDENSKRLDESYAREIQGKSVVEEAKQDIIKAKSEVENVAKIVNDTREDVKKQESNIESAKSEIESVKKVTYAQKAQDGRSNVQSVVPVEDPSGSDDWQTVSRGRGQQSRSHQNNGYNNRHHHRGNGNSRRSYYGTAKENGSGSSMGAPLPSRYVVIERVNIGITKADVKKHMEEKRKIKLKSVKLMSGEESMFKRYLLEISVEHLDTVVHEKFWPTGVRVRIFRGRGNDWRDREETEGAEGVERNVVENNNSSLHSN